MIQLRRGSTVSWRNLLKPLADGQPGYDRNKHKIKIGDGKTLWKELPYASGLHEKDILDSETNAKEKFTADDEDKTLFTFGPEVPDSKTVGQVYLQHYDSEPEADYIVSSGVNGGWSYQKWKSGIARCYGTFTISTAVQTAFGGGSLYQNDTSIQKVNYPFTFKEIPSESAYIQSPGGLVWIGADSGINTKSKSAGYKIISADKLDKADYKLTLRVEGFWR